MGNWKDTFQVSNPLLNPHLPFPPCSFIVLLAGNSHGAFILTTSWLSAYIVNDASPLMFSLLPPVDYFWHFLKKDVPCPWGKTMGDLITAQRNMGHVSLGTWWHAQVKHQGEHGALGRLYHCDCVHLGHWQSSVTTQQRPPKVTKVLKCQRHF